MYKVIQLDIMPQICLQLNEPSCIVKAYDNVLLSGKGKRRRELWLSVTFFTSNGTSTTQGSKLDPHDDSSLHISEVWPGPQVIRISIILISTIKFPTLPLLSKIFN